MRLKSPSLCHNLPKGVLIRPLLNVFDVSYWLCPRKGCKHVLDLKGGCVCVCGGGVLGHIHTCVQA